MKRRAIAIGTRDRMLVRRDDDDWQEIDLEEQVEDDYPGDDQMGRARREIGMQYAADRRRFLEERDG